MSSEQRTIRPFVGLDGFQRILDQFRLAVANDRVEPDDSIRLTPEGFLLRPVSLELAGDDELYEFARIGLGLCATELGFELSDLELVVIASSPYLKIADIVVRQPLDQLADLGRSISLTSPSRPRALRAMHNGCTVDAYVCLGANLPQKPLLPWRRGTWLAKISFGISSELESIGFSPRPLTEEEREKRNLPKGLLRFIELGEQSPLDEGTDDSTLQMWVDAEVLAKLSASSSSPAAKAFQLQLFLDAVIVILDAARADDRLTSSTVDDLHDTLFGRLITGLSRHAGQTVEQRRAIETALLASARDAPELFIAHTEAKIEMKKMMNEVLDS